MQISSTFHNDPAIPGNSKWQVGPPFCRFLTCAFPRLAEWATPLTDPFFALADTRSLQPPKQGKYEEAEPLYVRAMEIVEQILGNDHPAFIAVLHNRVGLLKAQVRG